MKSTATRQEETGMSRTFGTRTAKLALMAMGMKRSRGAGSPFGKPKIPPITRKFN